MARVVTHEELPADAGLSALGVLMRLGGALGLWVGVYALIMVLMLSMSLGVVGLLGLGVLQSYLHTRAGKALSFVRPGADRLVWAYVGVSLLHTVALLPFLDELPPSFSAVSYVVLGLSASWPLVVVGLMLRPQARAVLAAMKASRKRIFAEDLGITGTAALMTAMGFVGVVLVGLWMVLVVQAGTLKAGFAGWLTVMLGAGFLLRSFLHARAGVVQLRRFNPSGFRAACGQYGLVSVFTTAVVALMMLLGAISAGLVALLMLIPVVGIFMAWPHIVRDAGTVELRSDLDDDESPPIRPARDQGLVMLGMVLLAYGAYGACGSLLLLVIDMPGLAEAAGTDLSSLGMPETATWQSLLTTATSLWAGVELVGMTPRRKVAVAANVGIIATMTVLAAIDSFKSLELLMDSPFGGRRMLQPQTIGMTIGQVLAPLALPVVILVQVLRKPSPIEVNVEEVF